MLEASWFICNIICFIVYSYLFCKLINETDYKIDYKIIICALILGVIYCSLTKLDLIYIRPFIVHLYIFAMLEILYRQPVVKTVIGVLSIFLILTSSEILCGLVLIFIDKSAISLGNNVFFNILLNSLIFIVCILLSKIKIVYSTINRIINWYDKNELRSLLLFSFLILIIGTFILYNNIIKYLPLQFLLIFNLFCIGVFVFIVGFFKEKTNNNRIISEYEQLLSYVKIYEKTIEEKSKNQHEYKNQLILIKKMLPKNNKKVSNYIDEIIHEEKEDTNVELIRSLQYLPQGGLKGLIYYKVEQMINQNIDVYVSISKLLDNKKVSKVINDNLHDISKIVGVYIDNAIEAVKNVDKKYIVIEADIEKSNIIFTFSNTYSGRLDFTKIDKEGYTTKGSGKGYGLPLVKDIISKNQIFDCKREINGQYYVQKLYIKNKS